MRWSALAVACLAFTLGSSAIALGQPAVDLAFDPIETCPGETVDFFFSLENTGPDPSLTTIDFAVTVNGQPLFQFSRDIMLPAGEPFLREMAFFVPPPVPPTELTITVTATDALGSDTAEATLTVLDCGGPFTGTPQNTLSDPVERMFKDSGLYSPETESSSWGEIKSEYKD